MQLIAGYAAIANGGTLVTPHLIAGWTGPDGVYHEADVAPGERTMREETAATVLELLTVAIDDGIAKPAAIPGYAVAGKTGTAQVAGPIRSQVPVGTHGSGKAVYETRTEYAYTKGWIAASFLCIMPAR